MGVLKTVFASRLRIAVILIIVLAAGYFGYQRYAVSQQKPQYQTAIAKKGTLITNVTVSGQVTTANNVAVTMQASGVVKDVLVKNNDTVSQGQVIAHLTLDQASQQKQAAVWSNYLSAGSSLNAAQAKFHSLQSAAFKTNQKFINDAAARGLATDDPIYIQEYADWLQAEADYKNQQAVVEQAQAAVKSATLSLSQTSDTITAPVAGVMKGLTIASGSIITLTSQSTSSTSTSQVLGSINQQGPIQAQVNLSEIDSVRVAEGQKVTMILDAFPGKTFTGKVLSINTNGVVSSGVTTYPLVLSFDTANDHIYPNMGVNARIITSVKDNVLLVPSAAIQNQNGSTQARVLKNGQVDSVSVEVGDASDTQTEVLSGLSEGDEVVIGVIASGSTSGQSAASPFGGGRSGVGGAFRAIGGGGARGGD